MSSLQYIKGSGHLPGVPSRDLTAEEVKKFGEKMLLASSCYKKHTRPKRKNKNAKSD